MTRIDSRSMACILLDIDGVLHVSGEPIPGAAGRHRRAASARPLAPVRHEQLDAAARAPRRGAARDGLRARRTTSCRRRPAQPARELAGKRVLALVMAAIVPDLDGLELVGDHADAVLIGGCDETLEPNQVFSYMNLARAFSEIQMGASLYCLHKNKWWQTSLGPMLDAGALRRRARVRDRRRGDRAREAEPVVLRGRARRARRRARAHLARHRRRRRATCAARGCSG